MERILERSERDALRRKARAVQRRATLLTVAATAGVLGLRLGLPLLS